MIIAYALSGDFYKSVITIEKLLLEGYSGRDILRSVMRTVEGMDISEMIKASIIAHIGETEYRICSGGDELIQLKAFLASLVLIGSK